MCNVQIAGKYDATSVANFAKWGGGTPHVLQTARAGVAKGEGGLGPYFYVHIYVYTYVQITFMQVIWYGRFRGQGQNYTPPAYA